MKHQVDIILEGVRPAELAQLQALALGHGSEGGLQLSPLEAKGWVETVGGVPLITLTGRALLDTTTALAQQ